MSYQVIARKYRPQHFEDVVGQEHVTQTLRNAIGSGRIAHAYLFVGPRGTGKTTVARIFAKCLNCTGGPKPVFEDSDPKVQEITEGRSMDVLEIDGASNRGIDEVRELRETVKYAPASSKFKIYIIDEVHMLTKEAFNALLKTLEEPPAHVKFMFATTEPEKVLPTILSRCQRFDLRRIPTTLIVKHLKEIAGKENVQIDDAALQAIARGADGGMRDAESALDQLISFCGDQIAESDALSMFGLAAQGQILGLSEAVLAGDTNTALRQLNDLAKQGKDLGRLISELLNHFRNLLIFQVGKGDLSLLEVSEAEAGALTQQSPKATTDALTRIMEVLTDCEGRLRDTTSKKILVEVTIFKMIEARNAVSIDTILGRVQQLRAEAAGSAPAAVAAPAARPAAAAPTPPPPAPAAPAPVVAAAGTTDLATLWTQLLERVEMARKFLHSFLKAAQPVSLVKNVLTIGLPDPSLVDNSSNHAVLQTKLAELGHPGCQVRFVTIEAPLLPEAPAVPASAPAPAARPTAAAPRPAEKARVEPPTFDAETFKNDPLIQKALEVFKGQIIEVRS
ncbi:MAG TPA: DNA polymerase III subunit gamma/tau [Verrucomicrobiae bacterium]|jgi:DNA polymerase-3 subunit gamma/tau|nr:DNA polymerase III subunit gamma/tau [Verrucomicrobiae bacterium]